MVITNKYLYIISRQGFIRQAKNPLIYGISCIDEVKNEVSRIGGSFEISTISSVSVSAEYQENLSRWKCLLICSFSSWFKNILEGLNGSGWLLSVKLDKFNRLQS